MTHTGALVAVGWLAEALKSSRVSRALRLLDASWYLPKQRRDPRAEFKQRHIAGAGFFDMETCCDKTSPLEHMLPSEGQFAEYAGRLGVGADTHVVLYDCSETGSFSAPRAWWMFRVLGHRAVSVLDGGLQRWLRQGHPVTSQHCKPEPREFTASLDGSRVKTYLDVLDNVERKEFQLVDARPAGRFRGTHPEPRDNTEPGHIPGSINIPFSSFLDPSGLHRPVEEMRRLFVSAGVDLTRPLCVYCGSGVTACQVVLAAHLCGHQDVSVYDGSWSEWYTRASPEYVISEGRGKHV